MAVALRHFVAHGGCKFATTLKNREIRAPTPSAAGHFGELQKSHLRRGVRLLSPLTIDRILEVQSGGIDLVIGIPTMWGVGYGLSPKGRACAFCGTGGSLIVIDADRRMTFAYVMNKIVLGGIAAALAERVKDIVTREATCSTGYPSSSR